LARICRRASADGVQSACAARRPDRTDALLPGRALPDGDGWVLEPTWDGVRAIAHVTEQAPRLFTRHGRGHHRRFPRINAALAELPRGRRWTTFVTVFR
jgi:ATP-dependent DNA ligase